MPWFKVRIHGDLGAAHEALRGSEIVMREQVYAGFVDAGPPKLMVLSAAIDAETATAAETNIRSALPSGPYDLESALFPRSSRG